MEGVKLVYRGKGGGETEKGGGRKSPTSDLGLVSWAAQRSRREGKHLRTCCLYRPC